MFEKLLRTRYLFIIAVCFLLLNTVVLLVVGAVKTIHGYIQYVEVDFKPTAEIKPGVYILSGIDTFLIAMVCLIFGLGTAQLFIFDKTNADSIPVWLKVRGIKDLKVLLWETILVTLVVFCIKQVILETPDSWNDLVFPIFILILSLALYLKKYGESHSK